MDASELSATYQAITLRDCVILRKIEKSDGEERVLSICHRRVDGEVGERVVVGLLGYSNGDGDIERYD